MVLFALAHPSSTEDSRNHAERLRLELEKKLPPEEIERAQRQAPPGNIDAFLPATDKNPAPY